MGIKDRISRGYLAKGKWSRAVLNVCRKLLTKAVISFGWVNASYVYGLSCLPMHMRRALGTLTPYEQYAKATEIKLGADETIDEGSDESVPNSSDEAEAIFSSGPDEAG